MIQPGFMVLQSNRLENLRRVTVEWMRRNPLQPLENEVLLVQSNGIAQWMKLALAADVQSPDAQSQETPDDQLSDAGCGIAAALDIDLPGRFHWRAYRAVLGDLPETSPFDKPLLSWRLLRLLPQLLQEPEFEALQHFLADDHGQRKQFQLAQRLADLLDQYQIYRADWLNNWAAGIDQISRGQQAVPLPAEQRWQAALWRRLLQDIPEQARSSGRAQIHQQFLSACLQLSADTRPAGLPRRVVVFGLSSLPGQTLDVLAAIARCTQVLLCVHNPCMHYWGDIVDSRQSLQLFSQPYRRQAARADMPVLDGAASDADLDTLFLRGNPLLAAWGKQGRDYIRLLDAHDERSAYEPLFQAQQLSVDLFEEPEPLHQLARLQGDIFHLRSVQESQESQDSREADEADSEKSADQSISFHIAHGVQREVEILQDHLLALFNADPTLRPRDVLVMVPDINRFAPSIQAVFGRLPREDSRYLPFTISDQGKRHQAPVYLALSLLLQLPSARVGVSELLDFLDVPAVQRAFDISAADKPLLHRWIEQAGIRWGFHGQHRQSLGMPAMSSEAALEQNTWHFGLRRMLLGYAMGRDGQWQDIEAYDEIGGLSAALVGKLAHLLRQLEQAWTSFRQPATVPEWTQRLNWLLKQFFVATDDKDLLLLSRLETSLRDWQQACEQAQFNDPLSIEVVRSFLLDELDVQSLTQRFLAGSVNFATLMPMRAIPFRHICLLGMNDGDYPRQVSSVDFDLMRQDYRPGDRSRREDDRYLFLEALLSARESLYISWTGRSIHDNSERPPSVLLGQLRDYLADTRGAQYLASITHEYPLQPFSARYFSQDSTLFTYAHEWSPEQAAVRTSLAPDRPAQTQTQTQTQTQEISLADLASLLRAPADVYFEHSLGVNFGSEQLTAEDHEVFALDGLLRWKIQQQLMKAGTGHIQLAKQALDIDQLLHTLMRRQQQSGQLPIPPFAERYVRDSVQGLGRPLQLYQSLLRSHQPTPSCLVALSSSDGQITLNDQIDDIREQDSRIRCVLLNSQLWAGKAGASDGAKARIKWHYLARLWPQHLAAQLSGPVVTHIIGPDTREVLAALPRAEARAELQKLLDLWRDNLRSPLAACVKTSCAWLHTQEPVAGLDSARTVYEGSFMSEGEMSGNYALLRLWPDFDSLCAAGFSEHSTQLYAGLVTHWSSHRRPKDESQ